MWHRVQGVPQLTYIHTHIPLCHCCVWAGLVQVESGKMEENRMWRQKETYVRTYSIIVIHTCNRRITHKCTYCLIKQTFWQLTAVRHYTGWNTHNKIGCPLQVALANFEICTTIAGGSATWPLHELERGHAICYSFKQSLFLLCHVYVHTYICTCSTASSGGGGFLFLQRLERVQVTFLRKPIWKTKRT